MEFQNPKVPEGINVSRQRPVRDFVLLSTAALLVLAALAFAVYFLGGTLARQMPFAWEQALADRVITEDGGYPRVAAELQELAGRLAARMDLPEDVAVTVHYLADPTVNAFATLGGHVFVFRGLLELMANENALAMVLAHEIAHIRHRDPAALLGGSLLLQLLLSLALGAADSELEGAILGGGSVIGRGYGRAAEQRADTAALHAVIGEYGHAGGAITAFQSIAEAHRAAGFMEPPEFLSTHPLKASRIRAIEVLAEERGWPLDGALAPLPEAIAALGE